MSLPFLENADMPAGSYSFLQVALEPAESITLETAGTATSLTSGWAFTQVQGSNTDRIGQFAIFTQHVPGGQDQEATVDILSYPAVDNVPIGGPASSSSVLSFDNTAYVTGVAVINPNPFVLPLVVYIRNEDGNIIDKQILTLPEVGHVAFSVPGQWASTKGIAGTLQFLTYSNVVGILGLRFDGAAFTTFEVFQTQAWPTTQ